MSYNNKKKKYDLNISLQEIGKYPSYVASAQLTKDKKKVIITSQVLSSNQIQKSFKRFEIYNIDSAEAITDFQQYIYQESVAEDSKIYLADDSITFYIWDKSHNLIRIQILDRAKLSIEKIVIDDQFPSDLMLSYDQKTIWITSKKNSELHQYIFEPKSLIKKNPFNLQLKINDYVELEKITKNNMVLYQIYNDKQLYNYLYISHCYKLKNRYRIMIRKCKDKKILWQDLLIFLFYAKNTCVYNTQTEKLIRKLGWTDIVIEQDENSGQLNVYALFPSNNKPARFNCLKMSHETMSMDEYKKISTKGRSMMREGIITKDFGINNYRTLFKLEFQKIENKTNEQQ